VSKCLSFGWGKPMLLSWPKLFSLVFFLPVCGEQHKTESQQTPPPHTHSPSLGIPHFRTLPAPLPASQPASCTLALGALASWPGFFCFSGFSAFWIVLGQQSPPVTRSRQTLLPSRRQINQMSRRVYAWFPLFWSTPSRFASNKLWP